MENSLDRVAKALKAAAKVNDGSIEDERLQNRLIVACDELRERVDYHVSVSLRSNVWLPACNGTEQPFKSRSGLRMLYCWNPATGEHAYLNLDSDIIMTNEEATAALQV